MTGSTHRMNIGRRIRPRKLHLRLYSQVKVPWSLETPITPKTVTDILPHFVQLPIEEQDTLIEKHPKLLNVQLQIMLYSELDSLKTFKFICKYGQHLQSEFIQIFIYNLLLSNNLKATTTLLHQLLHENKEFQMSNELWALYMDKVCYMGDYLGATLIYHELVDNVKFYEETSYLVQTNNLIPFLINESTLVALAGIFRNNKDASRVGGIIQYFRRFYSFLRSQYIYKSLLILQIESYAELGDLEQCLKLFTAFGFNHNQSDVKRNRNVQAGWENIHKRHEAIQTNENPLLYKDSKYDLDIHQNLLAEICNTELFNPIIHRNVYSSSKTGHNPVINGSISVNDLPTLETLITEKVATMEMRELLHLTKMSHQSINLFIVVGLCNVNKPHMALQYLKTLSHIFPTISRKNLIKNQNFIRILHATQDVELAKAVMNYYRDIHNDYINVQVLQAYILVLLSNEFTTVSDLIPSLQLLESYQDVKLFVNPDQYEKFCKLTENTKNYDFIHVHS